MTSGRFGGKLTQPNHSDRFVHTTVVCPPGRCTAQKREVFSGKGRETPPARSPRLKRAQNARRGIGWSRNSVAFRWCGVETQAVWCENSPCLRDPRHGPLGVATPPWYHSTTTPPPQRSARPVVMRNYLEIPKKSSVAFCVHGGGALKAEWRPFVVGAVPDVGIVQPPRCDLGSRIGVGSALNPHACSSERAEGARILSGILTTTSMPG